MYKIEVFMKVLPKLKVEKRERKELIQILNKIIFDKKVSFWKNNHLIN